jgi:adenine/guanine/hypoxanthine permease
MTSATTWMGILGLMLMLVLLAYKKRSAFLLGISFVTFMSWFRNTAFTYFPDTPIGDDRFHYFQQVVSVEKLDKAFAPYSKELSKVGVALFTFL